VNVTSYTIHYPDGDRYAYDFVFQVAESKNVFAQSLSCSMDIEWCYYRMITLKSGKNIDCCYNKSEVELIDQAESLLQKGTFYSIATNEICQSKNQYYVILLPFLSTAFVVLCVLLIACLVYVFVHLEDMYMNIFQTCLPRKTIY
jgi:hypothetical protein